MPTPVLTLVEITPAIAETGIIDDVNSFANASAATFGIDVKLYLTFGNQIPIYTVWPIPDLLVR